VDEYTDGVREKEKAAREEWLSALTKLKPMILDRPNTSTPYGSVVEPRELLYLTFHCKT
jgi:hypothetical protein